MKWTASKFVLFCEGLWGSAWRVELARLTGLSPRTIWNYENDKRNIPTALQDKLCELLAEKLATLQVLETSYCAPFRCSGTSERMTIA